MEVFTLERQLVKKNPKAIFGSMNWELCLKNKPILFSIEAEGHCPKSSWRGLLIDILRDSNSLEPVGRGYLLDQLASVWKGRCTHTSALKLWSPWWFISFYWLLSSLYDRAKGVGLDSVLTLPILISFFSSFFILKSCLNSFKKFFKFPSEGVISFSPSPGLLLLIYFYPSMYTVFYHLVIF